MSCEADKALDELADLLALLTARIRSSGIEGRLHEALCAAQVGACISGYQIGLLAGVRIGRQKDASAMNEIAKRVDRLTDAQIDTLAKLKARNG